jgi:hypothetical protein
MDRDAPESQTPRRALVLRVVNPADSAMHVRIEPWGREYDLDARANREFALTGPDPIDIEVEVLPAEVVIYGWTESILDDIGLPVPPTPSRSAVSASSEEDVIERWREFVDIVRRKLGMYTVGGSLLEVAALLVGFDNGIGPKVLGGFQNWMSGRHPEHPEYAFVGLTFEEAFGRHQHDVHLEALAPEDSQVAAAKLLNLIDEYLADQVAQASNPRGIARR